MRDDQDRERLRTQPSLCGHAYGIANTLTLNFGYTNNSVVARTGNVNIFYLDDRWLDPQQSRRLYLHIGHPFGHYFGPKPAQEFYTGGGWADFGAPTQARSEVRRVGRETKVDAESCLDLARRRDAKAFDPPASRRPPRMFRFGPLDQRFD